MKTLPTISLFLLFLYWLKGEELFFLIPVTFILLFIYLFIPSLDRLISNFWLKFSHFAGFINTKILLSFIWYVFLTPMSLFVRNRKYLLFLKKKKEDSYYEKRDIFFVKENLKNIG